MILKDTFVELHPKKYCIISKGSCVHNDFFLSVPRTCYLFAITWSSKRLNAKEVTDVQELNGSRLIEVYSMHGGGQAQWLATRTTDQGVPGSRPSRVTVRFGIEQVTFTPYLVLVKPRKPWTYD